jgi:hypothetical protein
MSDAFKTESLTVFQLYSSLRLSMCMSSALVAAASSYSVSLVLINSKGGAMSTATYSTQS